MKYVFQLTRILAFCFAGEVLHTMLPLPVPASIYGLVLLVAALLTGLVRLDQIRETAVFLTGIFPLLFVPAAVGVMELRAELAAMLVPVVLAAVPVTVLVMAASGLTTQTLARARSRRGGQAQTAAQTQEEPRHE